MMRDRFVLLALVVTMVGTPATVRSSTPAGAPLKVTEVTLGIRHRVFTDFGEQRSVKLGEGFHVGDSEYSAEVVRFLPDFDYDIKKRRAVTRSQEPRNPAVQIVTYKDGAAQDTSWAFLNSPPHFARKSMLAFQVLRIAFANHPPVVPDTTAKAKP